MTFDWPLLLCTGFAVVTASLLDSWFMATRTKPSWVKWFYGLLLLGVAAKLVL